MGTGIPNNGMDDDNTRAATLFYGTTKDTPTLNSIIQHKHRRCPALAVGFTISNTGGLGATGREREGLIVKQHNCWLQFAYTRKRTEPKSCFSPNSKTIEDLSFFASCYM
jgi:hypothetical protein